MRPRYRCGIIDTTCSCSCIRHLPGLPQTHAHIPRCFERDSNPGEPGQRSALGYISNGSAERSLTDYSRIDETRRYMNPRTNSTPVHHLRVASVQMQSVAGDKAANLTTIETFVAHAADLGVKLVVFPECCITGYWFVRNLTEHQLAELAEPLEGRTVEYLIALAHQCDISIGAGFVERSPTQGYHNSYVVVLPDGSVHCHRKLHTFEHPLIQSGTQYTVFDLPDGWRAG